jgi:hypothetical protein
MLPSTHSSGLVLLFSCNNYIFYVQTDLILTVSNNEVFESLVREGRRARERGVGIHQFT